MQLSYFQLAPVLAAAYSQGAGSTQGFKDSSPSLYQLKVCAYGFGLQWESHSCILIVCETAKHFKIFAKHLFPEFAHSYSKCRAAAQNSAFLQNGNAWLLTQHSEKRFIAILVCKRYIYTNHKQPSVGLETRKL